MPDNGSTHLWISAFYDENSVTFAGDNGESFGLIAVALTGVTHTRCACEDRGNVLDAATRVEFTGFYSLGGTIQQSFEIATADETWQTYRFSGAWTGLRSVVFQGPGARRDNSFAVDNIRLFPETANPCLFFTVSLLFLAKKRCRGMRLPNPCVNRIQ